MLLPDQWIAVAGESGSYLRLYSNRGVIDIPPACRFPIVRYIDEITVLIVNARVEHQDQINAWIMDLPSGEVRSEFSVGDAVNDVIVMINYIVVSYFDEGIFGDIKPSNEGVAIFSKSGLFLYGYNSDSYNSVFISDCYALLKKTEEEFLFLPYTDFQIVSFNISNQKQILIETPDFLHGSGTITFVNDTFFLLGPYNDRDGIYSFTADSYLSQRIGSRPRFCSRGLPDGRVLGWTENSIFIMTISHKSASA